MEGYVVLKTTFSTSKVWMVLDGQHVTYYEGFDDSKQQPRGLRGALFVRDAFVAKLDKRVLKNGVKVKTLKGKLTFSCLDEVAWGGWFLALSKAAKLHEKEAEVAQRMSRLRGLLEIPQEAALSKLVISRAYKKLSLKAHPDKGGDPSRFVEIREAYNTLLSMQTDQDELAESDLVSYEACIEKKPGVGLGISVAEDSLRRQLLVTAVHSGTKIQYLSEESEGEIRVGDALIGIDQDDCMHWPMLRVKARLDASRVPMGKAVVLTFERRVPKSTPSEEESTPGPSPAPSPLPSRMRDETQLARGASLWQQPIVQHAREPSPTPEEVQVPTPPVTQEVVHEEVDHEVVHEEVNEEVDEEVDEVVLEEVLEVEDSITSEEVYAQQQEEEEEEVFEEVPADKEVREEVQRLRTANDLLLSRIRELTQAAEEVQARYEAKAAGMAALRREYEQLAEQCRGQQEMLDSAPSSSSSSQRILREYALLCQEKLLQQQTIGDRNRDAGRALLGGGGWEAEEVFAQRERRAAALEGALRKMLGSAVMLPS